MEGGGDLPVSPVKLERDSRALAGWGYLTAVILPVVGLICGIVLMVRHDRHGHFVVGLSLLFALTYFSVVSIGQTT